MLNITNYNINGSSKIDEKDVVYFSASLSNSVGTGKYTVLISKNIVNLDEYVNNTDVCENDYKEFEKHVTSLLEIINGELENDK